MDATKGFTDKIFWDLQRLLVQALNFDVENLHFKMLSLVTNSAQWWNCKLTNQAESRKLKSLKRIEFK